MITYRHAAGPIPAEYGLNGTLANLTWLSLYANRLTGSIPAECVLCATKHRTTICAYLPSCIRLPDR